MSFEKLSSPIRKYIRDKRWEQLRPIQAAAIDKILATDANYILASRTASGKTEAAFLPILSKVNFNKSGVQVLYISPLIALINDQFYRVEELCKYLDVTITKWHGEANRTKKEKLVKDPTGIVLITPESLEAMFVNKPYNIKKLFSNLQYVVIDEIHSFIGTDRGMQLKSLLSRIQEVNERRFSIVGLSATIADYEEAKKFTGDKDNTRVLLDRTAKEITARFHYFKAEGPELPLSLLHELYVETKDNKVLIFPNSRGLTEEIAVELKKMAVKNNGHLNYFSHHSSIDREMREYVEFFAKNNGHQHFTISCTSTLELGIDIGAVDEVVQIDATHSIASLIQRVGRSGRKEGQASNLFLYSTDEWSLLQSLACWLLYKEGFIEPPLPMEKAYDILLHQALSITKGYSGIKITELIAQLKKNFAFRDIETDDIKKIIDHLIAINLLEQLQDEVIIGIKGEYIVNGRDFFAMFAIEENLKVFAAGRMIGEVHDSSQIIENENILLAAKIWKIKYVDIAAKRIEVIPAKDGKKPVFFGSGAMIHSRVREKMMEILFTDASYDVLNENSAAVLEQLREEFSVFKVHDHRTQRLISVPTTDSSITLYSFAGTQQNNSLNFLLKIAGVKDTIDDASSSVEMNLSLKKFMNVWNNLSLPLKNIDHYLEKLLAATPGVLSFSKWGAYLPVSFQIELLKQKYFDFGGIEKINGFKLVDNDPGFTNPVIDETGKPGEDPNPQASQPGNDG